MAYCLLRAGVVPAMARGIEIALQVRRCEEQDFKTV